MNDLEHLPDASAPAPPWRRALGGMSAARTKEIAIAGLVLLVGAGTCWNNPAFLTAYNLDNLMQRVGMYGIFSIGMGLVIITAGIDLSVGSVFALEGVFLSIMLSGAWPWPFTYFVGPHWPWPLRYVFGHPWPWPVACLGAVAIPTLIGWFHGTVVTRIKLQPFIVTLCGYLFYRSLARTLVIDKSQEFSSLGGQALVALATGHTLGMPRSFVTLIVVAIVVGILLHRSVWGRYLYAVGRNEEAARYSGINSARIITSAYILNGVIVGIAGIFIAVEADSVSPNNHAVGWELSAIAAAVVGGCSLWGGEGSVIGVVLGTVLLILLRNMVNLVGAPSQTEGMVMGAVIFIGALVDQFLTNRRKKAKIVYADAPATPQRGFDVITAGDKSKPS
jgi:ribose transport system permease protein